MNTRDRGKPLQTGGRRGIAMVTAVMVVSVAAGIAAYLIVNPERWGRQAANLAVIAQAEVTARAAVDWGRQIVHDNTMGFSSSRIGENGPVAIDTFPVDDGSLTLLLDDAQGKFNLNNMVKQGKKSDRDILAFKRLLATLVLPTDLADTVVDWIDDDEQKNPNGAESEYYLGLKPPYRAANRQMGDIGELAAVKGFKPEYIKTLAPHVTVLPERALVNVNTAEAPVVKSLFKGMTLSDAENFVSLRKAVRFSTIANVRGRLPRSVTEVLDDDFTVDSKYFSVKVVSTFKHAKIRAEALLRLGDKNLWPIVAWYRTT
ncbi:MAG: type II secretion system minor pseudopilin GspK [Nitrospinae bacterium]|nr:type II secretion system minor pseudopilin GspK [Nitrospinota bacterium]